jgi:lipopolysaccharide export system protein LptA
MKNLLSILAITALPWGLRAQTNAVTTTNTEPVAENPPVMNSSFQTNGLFRATEIFSDLAEFDLNPRNRVAIYTGNVRVIDPQMKLTCEVLTVHLPEGGSRPSRIVAERNVVIDAPDNHGEPIHATGGKAIYTYQVENSLTNEMVELTINPRLETRSGSATGDSIIWDRAKGGFRGTNFHMTWKPDKERSTNAPVTLGQTNTP